MQIIAPYYFALEDLEEDWKRIKIPPSSLSGSTSTSSKRTISSHISSPKVSNRLQPIIIIVIIKK